MLPSKGWEEKEERQEEKDTFNKLVLSVYPESVTPLRLCWTSVGMNPAMSIHLAHGRYSV